MSDYDEVFDNTDPTEPCFNTLDPDGDGINSYFENTTGCNLAFIGISNGSTDIWVTDYQSVDTDNGGVDDRTEYFDSTNPKTILLTISYLMISTTTVFQMQSRMPLVQIGAIPIPMVEGCSMVRNVLNNSGSSTA